MERRSGGHTSGHRSEKSCVPSNLCHADHPATVQVPADDLTRATNSDAAFRHVAQDGPDPLRLSDVGDRLQEEVASGPRRSLTARERTRDNRMPQAERREYLGARTRGHATILPDAHSRAIRVCRAS